MFVAIAEWGAVALLIMVASSLIYYLYLKASARILAGVSIEAREPADERKPRPTDEYYFVRAVSWEAEARVQWAFEAYDRGLMESSVKEAVKGVAGVFDILAEKLNLDLGSARSLREKADKLRKGGLIDVNPDWASILDKAMSYVLKGRSPPKDLVLRALNTAKWFLNYAKEARVSLEEAKPVKEGD